MIRHGYDQMSLVPVFLLVPALKRHAVPRREHPLTWEFVTLLEVERHAVPHQERPLSWELVTFLEVKLHAVPHQEHPLSWVLVALLEVKRHAVPRQVRMVAPLKLGSPIRAEYVRMSLVPASLQLEVAGHVDVRPQRERQG